MTLFQISISVESAAIVRKELLTLIERNLTLFHTLGHPDFQLANQFLGIILHVVEYLCNGLAVDNLVDMIATVLLRDMYGIGVAEEVVHITENLLIGTNEEHPEVIRLVLLQRMNGQRMGVMTVGDEIGNLTIRVTSDILDCSVTCRTLVKPLDRHDGEELVDSPTVR